MSLLSCRPSHACAQAALIDSMLKPTPACVTALKCIQGVVTFGDHAFLIAAALYRFIVHVLEIYAGAMPEFSLFFGSLSTAAASIPPSHIIPWKARPRRCACSQWAARSMLSPFRVWFRLRDFQYCVRSVAFGGKMRQLRKRDCSRVDLQESQP